MNAAQNIMVEKNPNALIGEEHDLVIMLEDVLDPDVRIYRIEYRSTPDGRHAVAYCRYNPWGGVNGGELYEVGHVDRTGFICLGNASIKAIEKSPYTLALAIARARYWCTAFSVLKETGVFPNPIGD